MRVLFLQQQPCVRALKYAVALRGAFPKLTLGFAYQGKTLSGWYGSGDELFELWRDLGTEPAKGLRAAYEEFRPDLIHSHNLPDSLTVIALELFAGRVPVIHDVHDLQSLRRTPYEHGFPEPREPLALERLAIEGCSALVSVSPELLERIRARYRVTAPTLALPNYALRRDLPSVLPPPERRNGRPPRLVYQGTLSTNGGHYDLREIFGAIVREGLSVDVYPSRPVPGTPTSQACACTRRSRRRSYWPRYRSTTSAGPASTRPSTVPTSTRASRTRRTSTSAAACRCWRCSTARSRASSATSASA